MTPSEIVALFEDILGIDDVTADDNFFDVGGNSILALTLIAEIQRRRGVTIGLIDLVHSPTPNGLAHLVAQNTADIAPGRPPARGAGTGRT